MTNTKSVKTITCWVIACGHPADDHTEGGCERCSCPSLLPQPVRDLLDLEPPEWQREFAEHAAKGDQLVPRYLGPRLGYGMVWEAADGKTD